MERFLGLLIGLGMGIGISYLFIADKTSNNKVLSQTSSVTDTPTTVLTSIPSEAISKTPSDSPTPKPLSPTSFAPSITLSITPTPVKRRIQTYSSAEINAFIERFAGQYGVDPNILRHIAICESGFNASAINGPYTGLYQFSAKTWSSFRSKIGEARDPDLRLNAEEAVQTAAFVLSIGRRSIWPNCTP